MPSDQTMELAVRAIVKAAILGSVLLTAACNNSETTSDEAAATQPLPTTKEELLAEKAKIDPIRDRFVDARSGLDEIKGRNPPADASDLEGAQKAFDDAEKEYRPVRQRWMDIVTKLGDLK